MIVQSILVGSTKHVLLNLVGFQVGWFACVLGAAEDILWLGPMVVSIFLGVHLRLMPSPLSEIRLALLGGLAGWFGDTSQGALGTLSFAANPFAEWVSPPWMLALWINFALTLRVSLRWLSGRYWMGALLGAVGGPAAYYAGAQLGAIRFETGTITTLTVLACVWAGQVPLLLWLAREDA